MNHAPSVVRRGKVRRRLAVAGVALLALSACSQPQPWAVDSSITHDHPFRTSGYIPLPVETTPYTNQEPMLALDDPSRPVTAEGVFDYTYATPQGVQAYHPVARAYYAIRALDAYHHTGIETYLDRALANTRSLLDDSVDREGALWFPYEFDWTYYEVTLHAPWWSAMAQGQVLSLLVRLDRLQPDTGWRSLADKVFASFGQRYASGEPWAVIVDDGDLWLEEYAGDAPPLQVLNGHIYAMYGLHDYYMLTHDELAATMFDGAATTVLSVMPIIRHEGGISYYCARANYCQSADWQNTDYHPEHIAQLRMLAEMTGDSRFLDWANLLQADWPPHDGRCCTDRLFGSSDLVVRRGVDLVECGPRVASLTISSVVGYRTCCAPVTECA